MNATPYQLAARAYFDAGWSPLPLPHESKSPVPDRPTSFTGAAGAYVDSAQLRKWEAPRGRASAGKLSYVPSNVALRLPRDILGIDVDAHSEKSGAATLAKAEAAWGPLPLTWVSTSKRDGESGIRLFRIPEGLSWPGELPQGKGVELIRWDHRYMLVAPSIHDKTHEQYRWCRETEVGEGDVEVELVDSPDEFPDADAADIPVLPAAWIEGLTGGKRWAERAVTEDLTADDIQSWLLARPEPDKPCSHMRKLITRGKTAIQKASDDGGVHEAGLEAAWGALNDAKAGHPGIVKVLTQLRTTFLKQLEGRRETARQAKSEWARIVARGIAKVDADENAYETADPCAGAALAAGRSAPVRLGGVDVEELNGLGDANRAMRVFAGNVRWVPGWGEWAVWKEEGKRWEADTGQARRWVWKAMDEIEQEAALVANEEGGEAKVKSFMAHRKSRLEDSKVQGILNALKDRRGMAVPAGEFDANPRHLAVANGVVELGSAGVRLLPVSPDMYITKNTGIPWQPAPGRAGDSGGGAEGSGSKLWDDFLERFLPDLEVRDWLQRIVGYSLLGHNNARRIVAFVGHTSCGKSTFAEVIRRVLGDYGKIMPASVLRDHSDDRARPDLLTVFGSRVAVADEVAQAKHLHADQIKRLTGAVPLSARGMRSNEYVAAPATFTPWIVGNSVPQVDGADAGFERRVLAVPFDQQIPQAEERIDFIEEILAEGASAILGWCVSGYEKWLRAPRLEEIPLGAIPAATDFREAVSEFNGFCADTLDDDADGFVVPIQAYEAYQMWCARNGTHARDVLTATKFGVQMSSRYGKKKSKKTTDGKVIKVFFGVRLVQK